MPVPELIAERFTLRPLREADIPELTSACQDSEILRWCMGVPLNYSEETARKYIEFSHDAADNGNELIWGIDLSGTFAGIVSLYNLTDSSAEIGFWLAPVLRGQGLLTDAARVVLGFAFDPLGMGLDEVTWTAIAGNAASERVAIKLGFSDIRCEEKGAQGRPTENGTDTRLDARTATMTRKQFSHIGLD